MYIYIYTVRINQPHFCKEIVIRELPKNEKPEFDSSKQRGKGSCISIPIVSNKWQLLRDKLILNTSQA